MMRVFEVNPALSTQALRILLATLVLALAPHISRIPLWLTAVLSFMLLWRWSIQWGWMRFPGKGLRAFMVVMLTLLFVLAYRWQYTVDSAVAFLVLACCLKLSELVTQRDGYVLCFLTLFIGALNFLFSQSVLLTLYVLTVYTGVLVTMMALNGALQSMSLRQASRWGGKALMVALPITAVLYLFMPRLAPLWRMPVQSEGAVTGLGDDLRMGEIADLAQSDERAFRVTFDGTPPAPSARYWRSIILDGFDGTRWFRTPLQQQRDNQAVPARGLPPSPAQYRVWVEPHNRKWAFTLGPSEVAGAGVYRTVDYLARFVAPLNHPAAYDVWPAPVKTYRPLDWTARKRYLLLPRYGNPQSRELARRLTRRYPDVRARIRALLSLFREGAYHYTLKPPRLEGSHRVDAFLFSTLRGFCEHFAGATTFVLRASGIPARVVVGYQGGEWNDEGKFLVVRQYDAHAWVEAWVEGEGWIRLDPTAWVAPERVEQGLREAVAEEGSFLERAPLSLNRYAHIPIWAWLSNQMEEVNFHWYKWVVQFDRQRHAQLLRKLFGQSDLRTAIQATVAWVLGVLLVLTALLLRDRRKTSDDPVQALGEWLRQRLRRRGMVPGPGMPLGDLVRMCIAGWPNEKEALQNWLAQAEQQLYASPQSAQTLRQAIRQLKRQFRKIRLHGPPRAQLQDTTH